LIHREWTAEVVQEEVQRLGTVKNYLETNVIAFLQHDPGAPNGESDSSDEEKP